MFTAQESEYLKSLISVYQARGYKYYLAHTVTENYNDYDFYVYFSKEEITASTDENFVLHNAIFLKIDSSTRSSYNDNNGTRDILANNNFSGTVTVHTAEFVYTNAVLGYEQTLFPINPDLTKSGVTSYSNDSFSIILLVILTTILLFNFIRNIFRMK